MRWQILLPLVPTVSTFLAISVMWWSTERRREREAYYEYEISRLMLERYEDGLERVSAWIQQQRDARSRQRAVALRMLAWVFLLGGIGTLIGLRFTPHEESLFGWVPIGIALGMFIALVLSRRKA